MSLGPALAAALAHQAAVAAAFAGILADPVRRRL